MDIMNSELLTILFHAEKNRLYVTLRDFWPKGLETRTLSTQLAQQLYEKLPQQTTLLLNISRLKLMHPQVAEEVLYGLKFFTDIKEVRAIAAVEHPDYALVKLQFQRIAKHLGTPEGYPIGLFTNKDDAETWLDQVI